MSKNEKIKKLKESDELLTTIKDMQVYLQSLKLKYLLDLSLDEDVSDEEFKEKLYNV